MAEIKPDEGYPKLMKLNSNSLLIILAIKQIDDDNFVGTVLQSTMEAYPVGTYGVEWHPASFKEMTNE